MSGTSEICTYCLKSTAEVSVDHVIARAWYPASTPKNMRKWTVPACNPCNHRFSKLEDDLLLKIAICSDPSNPDLFEIINRVLRSVDSSAGKNEKDKQARENRRKKLLAQIDEIDVDEKIAQATLPFSRKNVVDGKAAIINVSRSELDTLIRKWCRGVHFYITGRRIPHFVRIQIFHVDDETASEAYSKIIRFGQPITQGVGVIFIQFTGRQESRLATSYAINIWNEFKTYVYFEETVPR